MVKKYWEIIAYVNGKKFELFFLSYQNINTVEVFTLPNLCSVEHISNDVEPLSLLPIRDARLRSISIPKGENERKLLK